MEARLLGCCWSTALVGSCIYRSGLTRSSVHLRATGNHRLLDPHSVGEIPGAAAFGELLGCGVPRWWPADPERAAFHPARARPWEEAYKAAQPAPFDQSPDSTGTAGLILPIEDWSPPKATSRAASATNSMLTLRSDVLFGLANRTSPPPRAPSSGPQRAKSRRATPGRWPGCNTLCRRDRSPASPW
jgi:hypothetical protein